MMENISWGIMTAALCLFVARSKYKQHKKTKKQWEGSYQNEAAKTTEELRQNENKYRKLGGFSGF